MEDASLQAAKDAMADGYNGRARRILADHLARSPDDAEARELMRSLDALDAYVDAPSEPLRRRAPWMAPPAPLGVKVLAGIQAALGALLLFLAFIALFTTLGIVSLLVGLLGAASLAVARGLWRLRPWAWWVAMLLAVMGIVRGLVSPDAGAKLGLVVNAAILAYLMFVHRAFDADEGPAAMPA